MVKKIDKLTPEQEIELEEFRAEWLKKGLSCDPANREAAESVIKFFYGEVKQKEPEFLWFDSPMAAHQAIHEMKWGEDAKNKKMEYESGFWGCHEAYWPAFYEFCRRLGVEYEEDWIPILEGWLTLSESTGWWWPFEGICVCSERPSEVHVEPVPNAEFGEIRIHNEDGMAVAYRDGWGIYAVNGTVVPEKVVIAPETLTVEEIQGERNAEIRRIMRERFGEGRYLAETGAKIIHTDSIPVDALAPGSSKCITRALMEDHEGSRWLVGSDGSTDRVYYMKVADDCDTCEKGHRSLLPEAIRDKNIILEA